jgi:hypothetical protein
LTASAYWLASLPSGCCGGNTWLSRIVKSCARTTLADVVNAKVASAAVMMLFMVFLLIS